MLPETMLDAEMQLDRLLFVDCEASSAGPGGYPIEVGWAWLEPDGAIRQEALLIRPDPYWQKEAWDPNAEAVHRIGRRKLEAGMPAEQVAQRLARRWDGCVLVSDAPAFDGMWLRLLWELGARPRHGLIGIGAIAGMLPETGRRALAAIWRAPAPHRAGPDAARLAAAAAAGLAYADREAVLAALGRAAVLADGEHRSA
jgi:hypothetical protein